jgi:hypothetical protein
MVKSPEIERSLSRLIPDQQRADAAVAGLEWALAWDPIKWGRQVTEIVWSVAMIDAFAIPLVVLYTFDDSKVLLLDILPDPT